MPALLASEAAVETMSGWAQLVNVFGLPLVLLLVVGLAFWRVAKWFAPRVEEVFQRQIAFTEKASARLDRLGVEMATNTVAVKDLSKEVRQLREALRS